MIDYQLILNKNLLNVLIEILKEVEKNGLLGNNHIYITFKTNNQKENKNTKVNNLFIKIIRKSIIQILSNIQPEKIVISRMKAFFFKNFNPWNSNFFNL